VTKRARLISRRIAAGNCPKCGKPNDRGRGNCGACGEQDRARRAAYAGNNQCPVDGRPVSRYKFCVRCRLVAAARKRKAA
jgi:hypothetical protein